MKLKLRKVVLRELDEKTLQKAVVGGTGGNTSFPYCDTQFTGCTNTCYPDTCACC